MKTTLTEIRKHSPCGPGWEKLLSSLGKTKADDEPLAITTVLDSNGLDDALWCLRAVSGHEKEIRLFAVWCARQVQHLMTDERSVAALVVAEDFANGKATSSDLSAAGAAAWEAAWEAAGEAAGAAAWEAAGEAAWAAAWEAAREAAREAQEAKLREICAEIETGGKQ